MSDLYENIQTSRLTVTGNSYVHNLEGKHRGIFTTDSLTFNQDAVITVTGIVNINSPLDVNTLFSDTGNIVANNNIVVAPGNKLKTNYLTPNVGSTVIFHNDISADTINEKIPNDGVNIDGALIKDGNFYANSTDLVEIQSNKNIPNGYAGLDVNTKIPLSLLPNSTVNLVGDWNAASNIPHLASSVGVHGEMYIVSVAGSTNLDGVTSWNVGDSLIFDGVWVRLGGDATVLSVNGLVGAASLQTNNIPEGTNLYMTTTHIEANPDVTTDYNHISLTSGNVHNLTAAQVGNTVAQWNANQLQGRDISSTAPTSGQYLAWNNGSVDWEPVTLPVVTLLPSMKMNICSNSNTFNVIGIEGTVTTGWTNNFSVAGFNFLNGTWTFPTTGNYRIIWGTVCDYNVAAANTGQIILNINGVNVSSINLNTYGGKHCETRAVWYQTVSAGNSGKITASNTSGNTMTLTGYFVSIDSD